MNEKQFTTRFILGGIALMAVGAIVLFVGYPEFLDDSFISSLRAMFGLLALVIGMNMAITGTYRGFIKEKTTG